MKTSRNGSRSGVGACLQAIRRVDRVRARSYFGHKFVNDEPPSP